MEHGPHPGADRRRAGRAPQRYRSGARALLAAERRLRRHGRGSRRRRQRNARCRRGLDGQRRPADPRGAAGHRKLGGGGRRRLVRRGQLAGRRRAGRPQRHRLFHESAAGRAHGHQRCGRAVAGPDRARGRGRPHLHRPSRHLDERIHVRRHRVARCASFRPAAGDDRARRDHRHGDAGGTDLQRRAFRHGPGLAQSARQRRRPGGSGCGQHLYRSARGGQRHAHGRYVEQRRHSRPARLLCRRTRQPPARSGDAALHRRQYGDRPRLHGAGGGLARARRRLSCRRGRDIRRTDPRRLRRVHQDRRGHAFVHLSRLEQIHRPRRHAECFSEHRRQRRQPHAWLLGLCDRARPGRARRSRPGQYLLQPCGHRRFHHDQRECRTRRRTGRE